MARLFSSGFEIGDATDEREWSGNVGTAFTFQTTTVRSGTYAAQVTSLASGVQTGMFYRYSAGTMNGPIYFRTYFRVGTLPSAENTFFRINSNVGITVDSSGLLRLYDEDGQIGSDSSALSVNTWYRIELLYDRTAVAGSHEVRARIDGVEFAGSAARNLVNASRDIILGGNLALEAQTTGNWYFDDVAINDTSGSFQTSYPGAGSIIHLLPNADGDSETWTPSTGTDNFANVDENPPDENTTYNRSNVAVGSIDDFNLAASGLTAETITLVHVGVRFRGDGTAPYDSMKVRVKASSGGTVEASADIAPTTTSMRNNAAATPHNYALTLYDLPGASTTAWTPSELDTAQIGVEKTAAATGTIRVTTMWLLVEYTQGEAPPATRRIFNVS